VEALVLGIEETGDPAQLLDVALRVDAHHGAV
jgi:hypothetical protein